MFWLLELALVLYFYGLAAALLFLAGAGRANERWDSSNDALWQRIRRLHSPGEEQVA